MSPELNVGIGTRQGDYFLGPSGGYYWNSCNDLILAASISVFNISCTSLSVIF